MKLNKTKVSLIILLVYVGALLCVTLLARESVGKQMIQTNWFWGYMVDNPKILYGDNILNILLYLPIGGLVALISPKHKWIAAMLVGLFLSETIECSQLIWQKGIFDVDDIFNNTLGSLLGGLAALMIMRLRNRRQ